MGGYGSGRPRGRSTVEDGLTIDLAEMLRKAWVKDGVAGNGTLTWSSRGEPFANIGHHYDLTDPDKAQLTLIYTRTLSDGVPKRIEQPIRLTWTRPTYGGRRWWMICSHSGRRVGKLHLPRGAYRFASRQSWQLAYSSQRSEHRQRPFDKLFRLQHKLGCQEGWESPLRRPKGMWRRTYQRHLERYWQLDEQCGIEMEGVLAALGK